MLWRLHIRPQPKNGKTHKHVVDHCINNNVAGIGWPVDGEILTPLDYELAARALYSRHIAAISFVKKPIAGDYVWARTTDGEYYLGRFHGEWFYSFSEEHKDLDIPNLRPCTWVKIGTDDTLPGRIIASFRPASTFQAIKDSLMEDFSAWAYSRAGGRIDVSNWLQGQKIDSQLFFKSISSEDCEDIVALYLQKVLGYCLIPSSCKRTDIGYEYTLKHSDSAKKAIVQVKQGDVDLDARLSSIADEVYLFTTAGRVLVGGNNVTVLSPETLFEFICQNQYLLPDRIRYWSSILNKDKLFE